MPKSRNRKDHKRKSRNRTNKINAEIKKFQKQQMQEQMKLLEQAREQKEANLEKVKENRNLLPGTSTPEGETYGFSPNRT